MDAVKFIEEKARMCASDATCAGCQIYKTVGYEFCSQWIDKHPTEAVAIVEKWSEEHPQKTLKDDFLEKYPNAPINKEYGFPLSICPSELGYKNKCTNAEKYLSGCAACWNQPYEEVE